MASDTHVTTIVSSTRSRTLDSSQNRFRRSPVKETGCPDPGCLPSTSCSPNPAFAGGLFGLGARHRSRRFATDDPASGALSLLAALSR